MYLKNINLKRLKQLVSPLLILLVLVLPVAVVSCEDMMGNYLEKPPGGDVKILYFHREHKWRHS